MLVSAPDRSYGVAMTKRPLLRESAASRLRGLADRIEPPRPQSERRSPAMLIRLGGRWWTRDDIVSAQTPEEPPADVQLLP
jgi:hypothetical protein